MAPRLLHVLPGFGAGGIQTQLVAIANGLGARFRHAILPLDGDGFCMARIAPHVPVDLVAPPPWARAPLLHPLAARSLLRLGRPSGVDGLLHLSLASAGGLAEKYSTVSG